MAEPALIRAGLPPRPGAERLRGLTGQGEVSYRRTGLPPYRLAGKYVEVRMRPGRLELPRVSPQDPKSCAYTNSATVANNAKPLKDSVIRGRAMCADLWHRPGIVA